MITLAELQAKARRKYEQVLQAYLLGKDPFPLPIPSDKTLNRETGIDAVFEQQRELLEHSKNKTGRGYWLTIDLNRKTNQSEIRKISFETTADFLFFIDKEEEYQAFVADVERVRAVFPTLLDVFLKSPQLVVEGAGKWADLLKVAAYFVDNPRPSQYVRSLPIDVPTKFIENNRPVLRELLDHLIPEHINADENDFYKRFHLEVEEPLVKIRFLDESLRIHPALSHVSVWPSECAAMPLPASTVVIIENLTSFLTFPLLTNTLAIWGGGFAVSVLEPVSWLKHKDVYYWGDLDAHGFQMLNQCRKHFPHTRALLMDQATFNKHRHLNTEGEPTEAVSLPHLQDDELELFILLKQNNWRIEQERIAGDYVYNHLQKLLFKY